MIHIVHCLSAESPISVSNDQPFDVYQQQAIYRLIGGMDPCAEWYNPTTLKLYCTSMISHETRRIGKYADAQQTALPFQNVQESGNVCEWIGVQCTDGLIESIDWLSNGDERIILPFLNPRWIPPTVKRMRLNTVLERTVEEFDLRYLPKMINHLDMKSCSLYGTLDIRDAPQTIVHLSVPNNWLSGTVDLRFLPPNLENLDARENCFDMVIADNRNIPFAVRRAYVGRNIYAPGGMKKKLVVHEVSGAPYLDERIYIEEYRKGSRVRLNY